MSSMIPSLPDEMARECLARVPYTDFHVIRSVCQLWKAEVDSTSFNWFRKTNGLTTPLIAMTQSEPVFVTPGPAQKYAFTPVYRLSLLEPGTGSWTTLSPPPGLDGLPLFCQIAGSGRELVLIGGWDPLTWIASDKVYLYDFSTATWRRGARMPGPRRSFFGCALSETERTVFVAGGHDEDKNALRSAMAYDVACDRWAEMPDMARERDECKGVFHEGKFHVIGGYGTEMQGRFGACSEVFDVATWRWGPVKDDTLDAGTCPRTCIRVGRTIYRCRAGKVVAKEEENGQWRDVGEIPKDATVGPRLVTWKGRVMVIGSGSHGGTHRGYVLDVGDEERGWSAVDVPLEFSGQVQAVCSLEI